MRSANKGFSAFIDNKGIVKKILKPNETYHQRNKRNYHNVKNNDKIEMYSISEYIHVS